MHATARLKHSHFIPKEHDLYNLICFLLGDAYLYTILVHTDFLN